MTPLVTWFYPGVTNTPTVNQSHSLSGTICHGHLSLKKKSDKCLWWHAFQVLCCPWRLGCRGSLFIQIKFIFVHHFGLNAKKDEQLSPPATQINQHGFVGCFVFGSEKTQVNSRFTSTGMGRLVRAGLHVSLEGQHGRIQDLHREGVWVLNLGSPKRTSCYRGFGKYWHSDWNGTENI